MNKFLYSILISSSLLSCKKEKVDIQKPTKTEQIYAENNYGQIGVTEKIGLKIYSDSSYLYVKFKQDYDNSEKIERYTGKFKIINDTMLFFPSNFKLNNSTKAVIKNNFVEFVDGKFPLKIEIKTNAQKSKNNLNFEKFKDYAVFTFNEKHYGSRYYGYKPNSIKPYDLKQTELEEVDNIVKKCFVENNSELRNMNDYVKQCIPIINAKQEVEVWISCYCKGNHVNENYKYFTIRMHDGGNCNIHFKINLTKHAYSELNIAGDA